MVAIIYLPQLSPAWLRLYCICSNVPLSLVLHVWSFRHWSLKSVDCIISFWIGWGFDFFYWLTLPRSLKIYGWFHLDYRAGQQWGRDCIHNNIHSEGSSLPWAKLCHICSLTNTHHHITDGSAKLIAMKKGPRGLVRWTCPIFEDT